MRKDLKPLISSVFLISLALLSTLFIIISDVGITGFTIRQMPNYEQYRDKLSEDVFIALQESTFFDTNSYIVKLSNYTEDINSINNLFSERNVKELKFIDSVAISGRRTQILGMIDNTNVSKVYLDRPVVILRNSALELINLTAIRNQGPSHYNMLGDGIKIGFLDTGINHLHPEFNCVPGSEGCIISKSISIVSNNNRSFINRNIILTKFSDNTDVKILDLSSGPKSVEFKLYGNNTIHSAKLTINDTDVNISLNGNSVTVTPTNPEIDLSQNIIDCNNKECIYSIEFSGNGKIIVNEPFINYSFSSYELDGLGIDNQGHGTMVAGILHKTAPNANLYSYKVLNEFSEGSVSDTITAIEMAIKDGVDILSLSLGVQRELDEPCVYDILEEAIKKASDKGVMILAASGNNISHEVYFPGCFDNAIAISSINNNKKPSSFMSIGPEIEFAMPGENIYSTFLNEDYFTDSGTSYATPFASSIFALLKQAYYEHTSNQLYSHQLRNIARLYAEDLNSTGRDIYTGFGLLHVSKLMNGLIDTTNIFSNLESVELSYINPFETLELSTNSLNSLSVSIIWDNLSNSEYQSFSEGFEEFEDSVNIPLTLNGFTSGLSVILSLNSPELFYINLDIDDLSSLPPGNYSTKLRILHSEEIIHEIPVYFSMPEMPPDFSYDLGLFSMIDLNYLDLNLDFYNLDTDSISGMVILQEYFDCIDSFNDCMDDCDGSPFCIPTCLDLNQTCMNNIYETYNYSQPLINYLGFLYPHISDYSLNNLYNLDDYFFPILKVNNEYSHNINNDISNYYIKIINPENESLILSGLIDDNSLHPDLTYYYFTSDLENPFLGNQIVNTDVKDTNLLFFNQSGNYTVNLIADITGYNLTFNKYNIQVNDNFDIIPDQGIFFIDTISNFEFTVKDNRGYLVNKLINEENNYDSSLYGSPVINLTLDGSIIDTTIDKNSVMTFLNSNIYHEGSYNLGLNYKAGRNQGLFNGPVSLSHELGLNRQIIGGALSKTNNLTLNLNFSKQGNLPLNADVALSVIGCNNYVSLNQTNFMIEDIKNSSFKLKDILIYQSNTNPFALSCTINANINIFGTAGISYNDIVNIPFTLAGTTLPIDIDININDTDIFQGEEVIIPVNVTNNGSEQFTGKLNVLIHSGSSSSLKNSVDIVLNPGSSIEEYLPIYFDNKGSNIIEVIFNNSMYSMSNNKTVNIKDDYLSTSLARNLTRIFLNDTFTISMVVTNNNNKQAPVSITIDNSPKLEIINYPSETSFNLLPGQKKNLVYTVRSITGGTAWISGTISAEQFSKPWNYSFNIRHGYLNEIELTDSFRRYTIGINDTLAFSVDEGCQDIFDDCEDLCKSTERDCKSICRSTYDKERDLRSSCREQCNSLENNADRRDCRMDCDDDFENAERDFNNCNNDCEKDLTDCSRDCDQDHRDCIFDAVDVEMTVDDYEEDQIFFEIESDNAYYSFNMRKDDSRKFDLNNDQYYETEIEFTNLIDDETYTCVDDCKDVFDLKREQCSVTYNNCRDDCSIKYSDSHDRADCRDDCNQDNSECRDDAQYDYDDCLFDCDAVYSAYEIRINRIDPVEPVGNLTDSCISEWNCTEFSECNETGQQSRVCIDLNECNSDELEKIEIRDCELEEPDEPAIPECNRQNLNLCLDETSCISAYGYWYDDGCHSVRKPVTTQPVEPTVPTPQPSLPTDESPAEIRSSNFGKIIMIALIILILSGLGVGGYFFMINKNEPLSLVTSTDKHEKLMDYFLKQLEKGNNINYIASALKKLGWDPIDIDQVKQEILNNPIKKQMVNIVRFAQEYGISDPLVLKQRFSNVNPQVLQDAVNEISKRRSKNLGP
jgi:subtilisin family serine protease